MGKNNVLVIFAAIIVLVVVGALVMNPPKEPGTGISDGGNTTQANPTPAPNPGPTTTTKKPEPTPARTNNTSARTVANAPVDRGIFAAKADVRRAIFGTDPTAREQGLMRLALMLEKAGSEEPDTLGDGIDLLGELFDSEDRELQDEALALMPNLDEPFRMPLILKGMNHEDPEYRLDALSLTRDLASVNVNDALFKGMQDQDQDVLEETADLFFYFSDKPIYEPVIQGLTHSDPNIREEALSFLEDDHTAASVQALIKHVLTSTDPEMVVTGGDALRFITDAEIESNNPAEWQTWWDSQGQTWAQEEAGEPLTWD